MTFLSSTGLLGTLAERLAHLIVWWISRWRDIKSVAFRISLCDSSPLGQYLTLPDSDNLRSV